VDNHLQAMEMYEQAREQALRMMNEGVPQKEILAYLTTAAETIAGRDTVSSILLLDKNGLLRNGASPRLPSDYLQAIDGLKPHAQVGTCAAAAATGTMVITESFFDDSKWAELRHLPLALGFKGAWSMPIIDAGGKVLGTFGTYFCERRRPSDSEILGIGLLAKTAAELLTGVSSSGPGYQS
jgi:GAF domain-containing protein